MSVLYMVLTGLLLLFVLATVSLVEAIKSIK